MNIAVTALREHPSPAQDRGPGTPVVSIVITNFNYAPFLRACVESALAQDLAQVEAIVVDDGSTDDSRSVLAQLAAEHPGLSVIFKENAGQASAINRGWMEARGDWIIFLDADDVLAPSAARRALASARDGDFVLQYYLGAIDREGLPLGLHPFCHVLESGYVFPQVLASGHFRFMPTSANMFRRSALAAIMPVPEPEWRICADTYLLLAGASQGRVRTVPEILGAYRIHRQNAWYEETLSPRRQAQIVRNHIVVWDQILTLRARQPAMFTDPAALSLARRVMLYLVLYRDQHTLSRPELAGVRRRLRRLVLTVAAPLGEKLLHLRLLLAAAAGRRDVFARLARLQGADGRHDWLANTARPPVIAELPLGRAVDFGQAGEGRDFIHYGFGATENWRSWSSAERAGLVFRVPDGSGDLRLTLDLSPFVLPPALTAQRLEIRINGRPAFSGSLASRGPIEVCLDEAMLGEDRLAELQLVLPDAAVPALLDPANPVTRVTAVAIASMTARPQAAPPAALRHPPIVLDSVQAARGLLSQQAHDGWDCSGESARLYRRRAALRFSLPNPVMERFVIRAEFERPGRQAIGDWRVTVEAADIGRDTIDLRETGVALIVAPRGKAPANGLIDLQFQAFDILPTPGEDPAKPGPRLRSIVLRRFDVGPGRLSLWRSHQIVGFAAPDEGRKYLQSGWHAPDDRGVWTADTRAVLGGFHFGDPDELFLTLRVSAWSSQGLPRQRVRVLANGVAIADRGIEETEDLMAVIPARLIGADRYLKLEIESLYILSVRTLGEEDPPRNVGVRLEKLAIEPLAFDRTPINP